MREYFRFVFDEPIIKQYIVFFILAIFTFLYFQLVGKYTVGQYNLLSNVQYIKNVTCLVDECDDDYVAAHINKTFYLASKEGNEIITFSKSLILKDIKNFEISYDVKTENVGLSDIKWKSALVAMVSTDESGKKLFHNPGSILRLDESNSWIHYKKIIKLTEPINYFIIEIQLANVPGSLQVKNLLVKPVVDNPEYFYFKKIALALWGAWFIWVCVLQINRIKNKTNLILPVVFAAVLVAGLLSQSVYFNVFDFIFSVLNVQQYFYNMDNDSVINVVFSMGHMWVFFLISLVVVDIRDGGVNILKTIMPLIVLALSIELLQFFSDDRTSELMDLLWGLIGIAFAIIVKLIFTRMYKRNLLINN